MNAQHEKSGPVGTASSPAGVGGSGPIPEGAPTPESSFHTAGKHFSELRTYAAYYLSAKADQLKLTVRNLGIYAVLGMAALVAGLAVVATAVVLLLTGAAMGLGELFGGRHWVGALCVGGGILGGGAGVAILALRKIQGMAREAAVRKYEEKKRQQRERFGQDVSQRAGGVGASEVQTGGPADGSD